MTTDITELAQREKFEAWLTEKPLYARYMHWCDSLKAYDYSGVQTAWEAYQAGGAELVEAVEKAQGMETYWKTQCRGITDHCEELQARIAELESRTVTVKLPALCVGVVQDGHAVMVPYPAGHWFNKTAILEMLAAAGIKVEAE